MLFYFQVAPTLQWSTRDRVVENVYDSWVCFDISYREKTPFFPLLSHTFVTVYTFLSEYIYTQNMISELNLHLLCQQRGLQDVAEKVRHDRQLRSERGWESLACSRSHDVKVLPSRHMSQLLNDIHRGTPAELLELIIIPLSNRLLVCTLCITQHTV